MKKILTFIFMLLFTMSVNAKVLKSDINTVIADSGISKDSLSISVKNLSTGKTLYSLNDKILMHPASVQKILTLPAIMEVLGDNYEFSTKLYRRITPKKISSVYGHDYLLTLGADPFLSYSDLKDMVRNIQEKGIHKVYIDDSIIEPKDWGEGWQWDDDLNASMPKFNSYNLDDNLMKITVMPQNGSTIVINPSKYPLVFFNNVTIGDKNNVKVSRDSSISSNTLTLNGTVSDPCVMYIPTNNLRRYFNIKLTQALASRDLYTKQSFTPSKKISTDVLISEVKHPISDAESAILKKSNNMIIETISKLAAAKAYNQTGTDILGIKLFDEYCKRNSIDNSKVRIVDASGVSKNNLVYTDFVTDYLIKSQDNPTLAKMAKPGEGTLAHRMIPLRENLIAKTGTLSDISSIAGYLTSKNGTKYAFCIIINDPESSKGQKAILEDYIIREIYLKG